MTVSSTVATETFAGDGATTVFTLPFRVLAAADVLGYLITVADDSYVELDNGVDFTVTDVDEPNATVTTAATYSALYELKFKRRTARLQETDYQNLDRFPAETHERALDRLTMITQEDDEALDRALLVPESETVGLLPAREARANRLLAFDSNGDPTPSAAPSGTAASVLADLINTSSAALGDALLGTKRAFANAVAATQHEVNERRKIDVMADCGAVGDDAADDYLAINIGLSAAKVLGADLYFPKPPVAYKYGTTLALTDGMRMVGEGTPNRWRSAKVPVRLKYTGAGSAVTVAPGVGAGADSINIIDLEFDGSAAAAGTIGLYLNATAAGSYIEGVHVERCTFLDFPENQARHDGTVFDVTYRHTTFMNPNVAASHCVLIQNGQPSQITFDDCWIMPYTAAMWAVRCLACDDLRFVGGTVAPYNGAAGANGIYAVGGLFIYGTHLEGPLDTQTGTIGVQYLGSNGAFISPSLCALFGTGIRIGDGTATQARGWTISGNVGNNNIAAGGLADVNVTAGGSRVGTIADLGFANGAATVVDARRTVDGVAEVMQMHNGRIDWMQARIAAGSAAAPTLAAADDVDTGWYWTGSAWGFAFGGVHQGQFGDGEVRLRKVFPGTPAGAIQNAAGLYGGTGAPNNADGQNGDFYLRSDGGAGTSLYMKRAGAWVGIV